MCWLGVLWAGLVIAMSLSRAFYTFRQIRPFTGRNGVAATANARKSKCSAVLVGLVLLAGLLAGCSTSNKWVALRSTPRNPLSDTLGLLTRQGPKPTPRTIQLLRRYDLEEALDDPEARAEAMEVIRSMIDRIELTPVEDGLRAELHGDLAEIVATCETVEGKKELPGNIIPGCQFSMVAGARNCLNLLLFISGVNVEAAAS